MSHNVIRLPRITRVLRRGEHTIPPGTPVPASGRRPTDLPQPDDYADLREQVHTATLQLPALHESGTTTTPITAIRGGGRASGARMLAAVRAALTDVMASVFDLHESAVARSAAFYDELEARAARLDARLAVAEAHFTDSFDPVGFSAALGTAVRLHAVSPDDASYLLRQHVDSSADATITLPAVA
jgi:hypothetical protein